MLYKNFNVSLASENIFGIGERNGHFYVEDGTYTIWNKDNNGKKSRGLPGSNLNGY